MSFLGNVTSKVSGRNSKGRAALLFTCFGLCTLPIVGVLVRVYADGWTTWYLAEVSPSTRDDLTVQATLSILLFWLVFIFGAIAQSFSTREDRDKEAAQRAQNPLPEIETPLKPAVRIVVTVVLSLFYYEWVGSNLDFLRDWGYSLHAQMLMAIAPLCGALWVYRWALENVVPSIEKSHRRRVSQFFVLGILISLVAFYIVRPS